MDRPEFKKQLARNLKAARLEAGMSATELASRSGLDISHISHFESGRRSPDAYNLHVLCKSLKTKMKNLIPNA